MPVWPTANSMPQVLPIETEESAESNLIRTDMDWGPRKVRRRFTAITRYLDPPADRFVLTDAQKATLIVFYDTTLAHGSLSFTWGSSGPVPEFDGDTITEFRFEERPEVTNIVPGIASNRLYRVAMKLEVLPR